MLPRIDYTRPRGVNRSNQDKDKRRLFKRPPQKPFDVDAIRYTIKMKIKKKKKEIAFGNSAFDDFSKLTRLFYPAISLGINFLK